MSTLVVGDKWTWTYVVSSWYTNFHHKLYKKEHGANSRIIESQSK